MEITRMKNKVATTAVEAVIFDLDGVITRTSHLHAMAWKKMFDAFLSEYGQRTHTDSRPMNPELDYRDYVDGRPGYEGAETFLRSRGIELPYGNPDDDPSRQTVCGLGNRKDKIYHELLDNEGPEVFEDTIAAIRRWRRAGKKTAVISSSKNCRDVLSAAGITDMFDFIADGNDAAEKNIRGKPAPDIFLYAASQLSIPSAQSVVVEDSSAGIRAGREGGFAYVVGITRDGETGHLYENGADIVVATLDDLPDFDVLERRMAADLPTVWDRIGEIVDNITKKKLLLLLDYDGTLTPVVARPEQAHLSRETADLLGELARIVPVGIVSGRDLDDLMSFVGIEGLVYAGSHGFDIRMSRGERMQPEAAKAFPDLLAVVENEITGDLAELKGVQKERKRFMLALHYRNVSDAIVVERLRNVVERITDRYHDLEITEGKKVFEVRPAIDWDKGKAVAWISRHIFGNRGNPYPVYIGDDTTDEDAFREVKRRGAAILVGDHGGRSSADYHLDDTNDVLMFLKEIAILLRTRHPVEGVVA